jgi:site-specific recombinase XerD
MKLIKEDDLIEIEDHPEESYLAPYVSATRLTELIKVFMSALYVRQSSKNTYQRTLKQYFAWINRKKYDLSLVARPQILEYKDDKDAFVCLTDKTYQSIRQYLQIRGKVKTGDPLFISDSNNSKGKRLTTKTISFIVKEGLRTIGLDGHEFTAHSLRHTTAERLIDAMF